MEQYKVTGMSCAACQARVEKAVSNLEGVTECSVNLLTNSMNVEGSVDSSVIIKAVRDAGYDASIKGADTSKTEGKGDFDLDFEGETKVLKKRFIVSLIILIPLMYVSMGHMMFNWPIPAFFHQNHLAIGIFELVLTGIIMVINQKFFISGFKGLIHRSPNMDTLVSLGATASFLYSLYALFEMTAAAKNFDYQLVGTLMDEFYFESAATILTLITLGKTLEARAKGKTTSALKALMDLSPKMATIEKNGTEITVPVTEVSVGDIFIVKPGDSVPVDGIVLEGFSAVNESAFTGESVPVDKNVGDEVSSATINTNGHLKCKATRVGEDTSLSKVIKMVSDASATKAPIAKLADRVSGVFVPVVIIIAIITFVAWLLIGETFGFAIARAVSVLVISCPCALGLATPVAIMVGNGVGAKNGILFKTAESLEQAGKVKIVALDKTGTITKGIMEVTDILPNEGISPEKLMEVAYSLENKSEHPISKAICRKAQEMGIVPVTVSDFSVFPGNGLEGYIGEKRLLGGNASFIGSEDLEELSKLGKTPVFFSEDGLVLGAIALSDSLKEDSVSAIKTLKEAGLRVVMITGDNRNTAKAKAMEAGVTEVFSEVKPGEKESIIAKLKEEGLVAMVGDGINDAPALTRADLGIAIGAGTDIAIDAADVVLSKNSLMDVANALTISRSTLRNIKENLFWAFIYNCIGIPLAAGCFVALGLTLNPMFGAAAMSLSSFCVVTNALRLNFIKVKKSDIIVKTVEAKENTVVENIKETTETKEITETTETEEKGSTIMKISVEGMMCAHCEAHVKEAIEKIPGVESAVADHNEKIVTITANEELSEDALKEAVASAGYEYKGIV